MPKIRRDLNLELISTSLDIARGVITKPTKTAVKRATIGKSRLLLKKSKKSRTERPRIFIPESRLLLSAHGIAISKTRPKRIKQAMGRFNRKPSIRKETTASISAIDEVTAAKNTITKNTVPTILP